MPITVTDEEETGIVGHLSPFVEIERDGIGVLNSGKSRRERRRENAQRAEGSVDMKPESLFAAQRLERVKIVDRADIDRPGRAYDEERLEPGNTIPRDSFVQRVKVHAMKSIGLDMA